MNYKKIQKSRHCSNRDIVETKKVLKVILNLCGENKINPMHHNQGHAGGSEIITPPPLGQYFNVIEMEF